MSNEDDNFACCINKGIDFYLGYVDWSTENNFNNLVKINWSQLNDI